MYKIASIYRRILAYMIDNLLLIIISLLIFIGVLGEVPLHGLKLVSQEDSSGVSLTYFLSLYNLFPLGLNILYFTLFTALKWQATPGQRIMNIYVIRLIGNKTSKLDIMAALERYTSQLLFPIVIQFLALLKNYLLFDSASILGALVLILILVCNAFMVYWYAVALVRKENETMHDSIFQQRVVLGRN